MTREMPVDPCVLGIDGGGTHTVCVILDGAGREIGRGLGGPSNHQSVGAEAAQKGLTEAVAAIPPSLRPAWGWPGWTGRRTCRSSKP